MDAECVVVVVLAFEPSMTICDDDVLSLTAASIIEVPKKLEVTPSTLRLLLQLLLFLLVLWAFWLALVSSSCEKDRGEEKLLAKEMSILDMLYSFLAYWFTKETTQQCEVRRAGGWFRFAARCTERQRNKPGTQIVALCVYCRRQRAVTSL